ncbi:hypothetical protein BH10PSE9_BH10PSE9_04980 [soil metagenome]
MTRIVVYALAGAVALGSLTGCYSSPKTTKGALIGGGIGALVGGIATGRAEGALVGGGLGAITGYYVAKNSYRCTKYDWFTGRPYKGWCVR